jgi:hypothetical protein
MSIVTLKNKSSVKYNNMSVGEPQFSLNGGFRSQGWVGQTMLSRSLPRTLMKGNVPRGHGGCCGKFQNNNIIQSGVTSLNDPNIIKKSSLNTMGMINTHYRWVRRPNLYEKVGVKIKSNIIETVRNEVLACKENVEKNVNSGKLKGTCGNLPNYKKSFICSVVTKDALKTRSQSAYVNYLIAKCNIKYKNISNSVKMTNTPCGN